MFKSDEIDSWNETFVHGKIQESDLKHPTEGFLVRTLVAYLQSFGYKVEQPVAQEGTRERRLLLVRLAANIDRILKFTDKSYAFYYYDLVKPVPKKTSHVLGILLNYYYYYNMFKKDVFAMANDRIKAHGELLEKIKATQEDIQERKERAKKIEEEIASFSKTVPAVKAELDAWSAKKAKQKDQLCKEHDAVQDLGKRLVDLQTQERNLKKKIVENDEALKLKSELSDLQDNIEDQLSTKQNLETTLNERMEIIKNLENLLNCLEETKNAFPSQVLADYKELTKKLKQSKLQHARLSSKKMTLVDVIAKQDGELKSMEEKYKCNRLQREQEQAKKCAIINEKETLASSMEQELKNLKIQLEQDNKLLENHRQARAFLEDAIREIMSCYIEVIE